LEAVEEVAVASGSRRRARAPSPHACAAAFRGAPARGRAAAPRSTARDVLPASCHHRRAQPRRRCACGIGAATCARCAGADGHRHWPLNYGRGLYLENAFMMCEGLRPSSHEELASSGLSLEAGARFSRRWRMTRLRSRGQHGTGPSSPCRALRVPFRFPAASCRSQLTGWPMLGCVGRHSTGSGGVPGPGSARRFGVVLPRRKAWRPAGQCVWPWTRHR